MRPINRVQPKLPVTAMQTYTIASPVETHTKPAHCKDIGCKAYLCGWITIVPTGSEQEATLRAGCVGKIDGYKRSFKATRVDGGMTEFRFEAGQPCFVVTKHRASLQRPEFYLVRGGDWRANTGLIRRHQDPEDWIDDFKTNMDGVARRAGVR